MEDPRAGRIIFVSSAVHRFSYRGGLRLDHLSGAAAAVDYDPIASYAQSKLAMVLHALDLNCRLRASRNASEAHVGVFAVHPGAIITPGSERARLESGGMRGAVLHRIGKPFLKSAQQGAATTVYCCVFDHLRDSRVRGTSSGGYFSNCNRAKPAKFGSNVDQARALWDQCERMLTRVL